MLVVFGLVFGAGGVLATIPLPLAGLGLYALALYISPVFVALLIGRLLMGHFSATGFLALVIGLIVLAVAGGHPLRRLGHHRLGHGTGSGWRAAGRPRRGAAGGLAWPGFRRQPFKDE